MFRLKTCVSSAAGFLLLAGTVGSFIVPPAIAQAAPVLVRDADNPARQPFAFRSGTNWIGNAPNASFFLSVPAGKRLVIEQVSFRADVMPNSPQIVSVEVLTTTGNVHPAYFFQGAVRGMAGTFAEYIGAASMRSYSDPGGLVEILVTRSNTAGGSSDNVDLSVSGYLVDLP